MISTFLHPLTIINRYWYYKRIMDVNTVTAKTLVTTLLASSFSLGMGAAMALDDPEGDIEHIRVRGDSSVKDGEFISASQGWVSGDSLIERPMLRAGEILEYIPGMMVTQHSGSGKANQYFLRGFNLDHGTDFTVSVDGMPVNMRSHGYGQV